MEPRLSVWSSFLMELPPEEALGELARAGWPAAELSDEHGRALLACGQPQAAGRDFRRRAEDLGVQVGQGHLWLTVDIAPADEEARRQAIDGLKPWLDLYLALGIRAAVLHPGGRHHAHPAALLDERLRSLAELAAHVRGSAMVLCLENCSSGADLLPTLEATDPQEVGVCLDTGHLNLTAEPQADFIRAVGPRLQALHLNDNDGTADQHNFPYARGGSVPWQPIAAALEQGGYAGLLNFEVPGERRCPLGVRRLKLAYLRALAAWMFPPASC
ncbi:MAG: sugar phosphate isomerase/epimerase family protein [Candidatus Brocadiia bacterium]